jgi:hypothetical protein
VLTITGNVRLLEERGYNGQIELVTQRSSRIANASCIAFHSPQQRSAGKLMDDEKLKPVALVMDPSMSAEARRQLVRKINGDADLPAGCGFMLSVLGAITLIILYFATGLSWWWMFASALPTLIGGALTAERRSQLDKLDDSHFVRPSDLDKSSRKLMFRAQDAIRTVLGSGVNARNSLGRAAEELELRRHEWDVAKALRKISKLRSELEASAKDGTAGPVTADVLNSQRRALTLATDATTSRISALERYAAELKAADAAESDWRAALKASDRNDQYLDLIAGTAADDYAIAEINDLTEHAATAAQEFRDHLHQASLAAQALDLPASRRIDDL